MLIQQFEEIKKDKNQSIIIISHQEKIMEMADRVMVIEDGKVAGVGKREDILPMLVKHGPSCCVFMKKRGEI